MRENRDTQEIFVCDSIGSTWMHRSDWVVGLTPDGGHKMLKSREIPVDPNLYEIVSKAHAALKRDQELKREFLADKSPKYSNIPMHPVLLKTLRTITGSKLG